MEAHRVGDLGRVAVEASVEAVAEAVEAERRVLLLAHAEAGIVGELLGGGAGADVVEVGVAAGGGAAALAAGERECAEANEGEENA